MKVDLTLIARTILDKYRNEFSQRMIDVIVSANVNLDWYQTENAWHYMPRHQGGAEMNIQNRLERALDLYLSGKDNIYDAMFALGEALHTVQDRSAHFDQNAGWWKHLVGNPDNSDAHPFDYLRANLDTDVVVKMFLEELNRRRRSPCNKI